MNSLRATQQMFRLDIFIFYFLVGRGVQRSFILLGPEEKFTLLTSCKIRQEGSVLQADVTPMGYYFSTQSPIHTYTHILRFYFESVFT